MPSKVMLLGNHASGKSSFLRYYDKGYKKQGSTHVLNVHKTKGANFYDFGGQDYYHGVYQAFLTAGALHFLFWHTGSDLNQIHVDSSGKTIRHFDRTYWLGQIRYAQDRWEQMTSITMDFPIYLIQTHADEGKQDAFPLQNAYIIEGLYTDLNPKRGSVHQYSREYLKQRARQAIAQAQEGVELTQAEATLYQYLQAGDFSADPMPVEELRDKLYSSEKSEEVLSMAELRGELNQLYLRGEVLYYHQDEDLANYVWLNPMATVAYIHKKFLGKKRIGKGCIGKSQFERNLSDNDRLLLKLMLSEQMIFLDKREDEAQSRYIIPSYLPLHSEDPVHEWVALSHHEANFILKFDEFIPFGLINQLICHYGRRRGALKACWRDQVAFTLGKDEIVGLDKPMLEQSPPKDFSVWINLDFEQLCIAVHIRGYGSITGQDIKKVERLLLDDIFELYWGRGVSTDRGHERRIERRKEVRRERSIPDLYIHYRGMGEHEYGEKLFVSVRELDGVELKQGEKEQRATSRLGVLLAHPCLGAEQRYRIDRTQGVEVSVRSFAHLSISKWAQGIKKIFISYSKEDLKHRDECVKFLVTLRDLGLVEYYYDELTRYGERIHPEIRRQIIDADYAFVLVSQSLLATEYITKLELPLMESLGTKIVPIIIGPSTWEHNKIIAEAYVALKGRGIETERGWGEFIRDFTKKELNHSTAFMEDIERLNKNKSNTKANNDNV